MFYIVFFLKVFLQRKLMGFLFILSLVIFSFALPSISLWRPFLLDVMPWQKDSSYFIALVSGLDDLPIIESKMRSLPGVKLAVIIPPETLKKELDALSFDGGVALDELRATYGALRIEFESHIKPESEGLIRDYLIRYVGEERVTAGKIRTESSDKKLIFRLIEQWVQVVILSFLALLHFFTFWSLRGLILKDGYLVERFQRRSGVATKSFLIFSIPLSLLGVIWAFLMGEFLFLPLCFIFPLIFLEWLLLQRRFVWISE